MISPNYLQDLTLTLDQMRFRLELFETLPITGAAFQPEYHA